MVLKLPNIITLGVFMRELSNFVPAYINNTIGTRNDIFVSA